MSIESADGKSRDDVPNEKNTNKESTPSISMGRFRLQIHRFLFIFRQQAVVASRFEVYDDDDMPAETC